MQSPPMEWALGIGYLAIIDYIRDQGEPDGDTLSECIRHAFQIDKRGGRLAWAGFLVGGGLILHRHIVKPGERHR
jgi:hypothetical protein